MSTLGNYCKAYPITRFREYGNWVEKPVQTSQASSKTGEENEASTEEQYLFLQENFIVTDGIFLDENIVFDDVNPEWEQFCRNQLEFQIPAEALPNSQAGS